MRAVMNTETQQARHRRRTVYILLLFVTLALLVFSLRERKTESAVIAIPTLAVILDALAQRENAVRIPPVLVGLVVLIAAVMFVGRSFQHDFVILQTLTDFLIGVFLALVGLIVIYVMLRMSLDSDRERPFFIAFSAFCIAVALFVMVALISYGAQLVGLDPAAGVSTSRFFAEVLAVMAGALFVAALYYLNRHNGLFEHTLGKLLAENTEQLGIADREREEVRQTIAEGESSHAEFKSTLRTNLKTGEKDARMERAVLKTVVAFLNSKGGTLLVGVADDGTVLGADIDSFEGNDADKRRDRFLLHFNNLITSQIGSEFLPYIVYGLVDLGDRTVLRVNCRRSEAPVFLREGKEMTFFVRSGPSSIDLHGMDLLYYADHNFGRMLRKPDRPERQKGQ